VFESRYPWVRTGRRPFDATILALLEETGPCVMIGHSAGGPPTVSAARARPDLVPALILIEPTGPPNEADFPALAGRSMLGVYGDYIASRNQAGRLAGTTEAAALFAANGGVGDIISMPQDQGVNGNTHLMMQDDNHEAIADLVLGWLLDNGLAP